MKHFWWVAIGAALGGLARYYLGGFVQERAASGFPAGTFAVNILGSFIVGVIVRFALEPGAISEPIRLLLIPGFCGGFTTFSAFSVETIAFLQEGRFGRATTYVGLSVALALTATFAGFALANRVIGRSPYA